jgi:RimJ/RimL family protein N-acetyltransferase
MTGIMLTTARLELWQPQAGDLADFHALTTDPEARRFLGPDEAGLAESFSRLTRNAGGWALHGYGMLMLRFPGQQRIIGACGVFHTLRGFGKGMDDVPEAGWSIHPEFWHQGIASEAMQAIMVWFDRNHGPRRVVCMIEEGHVASHRLACALGFAIYARHETEDDAPLILYERLAPPGSLDQPL